MQWRHLLTGVGTTLWQVYHYIKQVIISPLQPSNKKNVFLGLTVKYDNISKIFIFGVKITANIPETSSYNNIQFYCKKYLHLNNRTGEVTVCGQA